MRASLPPLPDVVRAILKGVICSLTNAGLLDTHTTTMLIAYLELHDA